MTPIDVVAAIIERDGTILLAQRDDSRDQAGLWEFPGGKVEAGESQPQALARELAEELGIVADIGDFVASQSWQSGERLIRLHAWRVPQFCGELRPTCHQALVWVTPEAAAGYALPPADLPLLAAYRAQRGMK
ncbi:MULTISPECIES: pyrimidine (deoxy)nucleoside triphosphate diphosphatase [Yersiniaceae]|uniref:pyrimidine (deoxy)nucleoside triphosphate diphosphatase n=1 Tax=Yersiniaceae TaxID=1903411 RepID=UPI0009346DB4|nr:MULTISPECIES: pyrimidine (deoxy)nucleoside triphosphate diphosphatase [Yersiniaceae]MDV5139168.1 pyrimidine (deoxy)nucleoside triphosphate diphosphatase [Chimaeribacter arupi]PLR36635.1 NUDIX domain-containing protein [Chimaeribacter arupi]